MNNLNHNQSSDTLSPGILVFIVKLVITIVSLSTPSSPPKIDITPVPEMTQEEARLYKERLEEFYRIAMEKQSQTSHE